LKKGTDGAAWWKVACVPGGVSNSWQTWRERRKRRDVVVFGWAKRRLGETLGGTALEEVDWQQPGVVGGRKWSQGEVGGGDGKNGGGKNP